MLKVMLVDDEFLVCNFLRNLILWEKHGFIICGEAHNGSEALEMLSLLRPDIALIDVSMPVMDGIELMRIIKQANIQVRVIILSSYSDYDYVRETLKLGAIDYLLKHRLDAQELIRVLEIAKDGVTSLNNNPADVSLQDDLPPHTLVMHDSRIRSFLEGKKKILPPAVVHMENTVIAVAEVHTPIGTLWNSNTSSQGITGKLIGSLLSMCNQILYNVNGARVTYICRNRFAFLLPAMAGEVDSDHMHRVARCMGIIKDAMLKYHNAYIVWAASCRCINPADLPQGYAQAVRRLHESPAELNSINIPSSLTLDQERRLLSCVYKGDLSMLHNVLQEILAPFGNEGLYKTALQLLASDLLTLAVKLYQYRQLPLKPMQEADININDIQHIGIWLENLFMQLIKSQINRESKQWSPAIKKATAYIAERYMNVIGLAAAADHCNMNPSYLSHLFKKEVGMGFTQCLNRVRIAHSMNLILFDDVPASIVSLKVGFNNYNHFFNIFKSITGTNPTAFKQDKKNMEWAISFDPFQVSNQCENSIDICDISN